MSDIIDNTAEKIEENLSYVKALQEMLNEEIQKERRNYETLLKNHEDYKNSVKDEKKWYRYIIIALIAAMVALNAGWMYYFFQYDFETITVEQKADSKDGGNATNNSSITK